MAPPISVWDDMAHGPDCAARYPETAGTTRPRCSCPVKRPREVRCTAEGYWVERGMRLWARRLRWAESQGTQNLVECGSHKGISGYPVPLTARDARRGWDCSGCGQRIEKGDLHGSTYYDHFCLECCTPFKPEAAFAKNEADWRALKEMGV